jgi:flagellar motor switch protein FliN/FliY
MSEEESDISAEDPAAEAASPGAASPGAVTEVEAPTEVLAPSRPLDFSQLPAYSRSLLKIHVPVRMVLASRKENLKDIVELAPGTIIKFEKACDELLELFVGDQAVAEGEAVKVGDKFGFRVLQMLMPDEHFLKVRASKAG